MNTQITYNIDIPEQNNKTNYYLCLEKLGPLAQNTV